MDSVFNYIGFEANLPKGMICVQDSSKIQYIIENQSGILGRIQWQIRGFHKEGGAPLLRPNLY